MIKTEYQGLWDLIGLREPIILASQSPRRADLLRSIGLPFEIWPAHIEETPYQHWDGGRLLQECARRKAQKIKDQFPQRAVLAADTLVVIDDVVLGKPRNQLEAQRMLELLSGRIHNVWTAVCYAPAGRNAMRQALSGTRVTFRALSPAEISDYVATGEPLDKAGAYGIQGLGGLWVEKIEGCYFNVVGLPLSLLWDLLQARPEEVR